MKKLISVFAALALVGAVAAKPAPKKAPAKPAPAVAAPVAPAPAAAAASVAKAGGLNVGIGVYGGWNIPSGDAVTGATTKGGIVSGATFLIGTDFIRGGVSAAYMTVAKTESSILGVTFTTTSAYLPIEALVRIYPFGGLYVGGFGGYALDMGSVSGSGTYTKNNGISFGGGLGYVIELGAVGIDIGADFRIVSVSTTATATTASTTSSITNIVPRVGVNFKF